MVNLLLSIIIAGFAITFVVELIALATSWFFKKEILYALLSLPLSFFYMSIFTDITTTLFVSVPASAFVALMLNRQLNASKVSTTRLQRL